jgi:hypothetical protein
MVARPLRGHPTLLFLRVCGGDAGLRPGCRASHCPSLSCRPVRVCVCMCVRLAVGSTPFHCSLHQCMGGSIERGGGGAGGV